MLLAPAISPKTIAVVLLYVPGAILNTIGPHIPAKPNALIAASIVG